MATDVVKRAALRLRQELKKAQAGGYYSNGWYSYMDREDIEALVLDVLGPETVEPIIRVTVCRKDGTVLYETEAVHSDIKIRHNPDGSAEIELPEDGWVKNGVGPAYKALLGADQDEGGSYDPRYQVYTTGVGQTITNIHTEEQCEGRPCTIHRPSDHHMRSWPTNWRDGGVFDIKGPHMERICPHGVGHPDPDDLEFNLSQGRDYSVHGCDGCCRSPEPDPQCSGSGYAHAAHGNCRGYTYDRT
jgi:hypothetical protein